MTAYLERGRPVTLLMKHRLPSRANPPAPCPPWLRWRTAPPRWRTAPPGAPRNAAVRRSDGVVVVRPFRGLRRPA